MSAVGCSHQVTLQSSSSSQSAFVSKVHDGDTITVVSQLAGIDCPETAQPYGQEATAATRSLVLDVTAAITEMGTDRYGRTIAEVRLPDG